MNAGRVEVRMHCVELPLRHAFGISRFTHTIQPSLIVELNDGVVSGFGEATTDPYYGVSIPHMVSVVEAVRDRLQFSDWDHPAILWEMLGDRLAHESFVRCAIDQAAHDLWGKVHGKPTYEMLGIEMRECPVSSFTIGLDRQEMMVQKLLEEPDWPIYKIKLGTDHDLQLVEALRKHSEAVFRVDANCGWTAQETIENAVVLKDLGVEFIEQPLPADDWDGARRVYQESVLPIIADESCLVASDIDRCVNHFHGVNIKMVKCGGITPALAMVHQAKRLGMKVMLGCMTESSVGISAIAQLLPLLDYVDIDGANLLAADIASGVKVERGVCQFPETSGNGISDFQF
ncbi:MAG: dipeptide epimerase [Rubripirellula sp.]